MVAITSPGSDASSPKGPPVISSGPLSRPFSSPAPPAIPDTGLLTPDAAFDREWAITVVARAIQALQGECAAEGRAEFFEKVKPWLTGEADRGNQAVVAQSLAMNANSFKVAVHRLKRRFRQILKEEIEGTLEDPALVESEMRALFAALGG